jgi:hypothetical protein
MRMRQALAVEERRVDRNMSPSRAGILRAHTSAHSVVEIIARLTACRLAVGACCARDGHRVADSRAG